MNLIDKLITLEKEADDFGFSWETAEQILSQINSECQEIQIHLIDQDKNKLQEEIGDLMHAVFSLCIFCQCNPMETLDKSTTKFQTRLKAVKQLAAAKGLKSLKGKSFKELMTFWDEAKKIT